MIRLYAVILFHHLIIFGAVFSAIGSFFTASLPVAVGLLILILRLGTSPVGCIITEYENKLREWLGLRQIGGFIGHYYVKPVRILLSKIKRSK